MRRVLTTALLPALVAAGCTTMEPREPRAPLDGRVSYTPDAGLTVSLNRSAHVAIFDIVPGHGVGLVYPTASWQDGELAGGFTPLTPAPNLYYHWYFSPATFAGFQNGGGSAWQPRRPFLHGEPRFLLMVASEAPLDLEALAASPGALRRALGMATFTSLNPDRVMDQLVATVVPEQEADAWTTSHWVSWPADYDVERDSRILWIRCADGNYDAVPAEFLVMACPGGRGLRVPPGDEGTERAPPQGAPAGSRPPERVTVELDTEPVDRTPASNRPTTFRPDEDAFRARVIGQWETREREEARGTTYRETGRQTHLEPRERSAQPREQMPSRAGGASSTPARPAAAPEAPAGGTGGGGSTGRGTLPGGSN